MSGTGGSVCMKCGSYRDAGSPCLACSDGRATGWTALARAAGWLSPDGVQHLREHFGELRKKICFEYEQVIVAERAEHARVVAEAAALREALLSHVHEDGHVTGCHVFRAHTGMGKCCYACEVSVAALAADAGSRLLAELHARRVLDKPHTDDCNWRAGLPCDCGLGAEQIAAMHTLKEITRG